MPNEPIIYLRWQDRHTRRWFVVGRLRLVNSSYEFVYTKGYQEAQQVAGMQPISGFPDPLRRYLSESLFPIFQNRLMSQSREEYSGQLKRLGLQHHTNDPLLILARSRGGKVTDPFDVIPAPMELISEGTRTYT